MAFTLGVASPGVMGNCPPLDSGSHAGLCCPVSNGLDGPAFPMGGSRPYYLSHLYSAPFSGGKFQQKPCRFHGGSCLQCHAFAGRSLPSLGSTTNHWCSYNFPGSIPLAIPSFMHSLNLSPPCPHHGGFPHALASKASLFAFCGFPAASLGS